MNTVTIKATAPSADDQAAIKAAIASLKQKRRLSGYPPPHDKVWVPPQSIVPLPTTSRGPSHNQIIPGSFHSDLSVKAAAAIIIKNANRAASHADTVASCHFTCDTICAGRNVWLECL